MHRFCVPPPLRPGAEVELPEDTARQIARVLRLRPGAAVILFCGDGAEYAAELCAVTPHGVSAVVQDARAPEVELPRPLEVAVAVLKGEKLDWTVQKLTELGAAAILLMETERTVVTAGEERWPRRLERFRRIAREAAEQSGRVRLPEIREPRALAALLAGEQVRLWCDPEAPPGSPAALPASPAAVRLFLGPEGGFSPAETGAAREAGALPVWLGRRVLRAETAAVAAAVVVGRLLEAPERGGQWAVVSG